jgi:hypothetical protein
VDSRDSGRKGSCFGESSVAEVDRWEHAHFHEEELCKKAKAAKKDYEVALPFKFFAIPE